MSFCQVHSFYSSKVHLVDALGYNGEHCVRSRGDKERGGGKGGSIVELQLLQYNKNVNKQRAVASLFWLLCLHFCCSGEVAA